MKYIVILCFLLSLYKTLDAVALKRDAQAKTKQDEDIYGDLEENGNIQKDGGDYYDEDIPEEPPEDTGSSNDVDVKIISKPETLVQEQGTVAILPCQTSKDKDTIVRVWSKESTLIYQGDVNIDGTPNYKLVNNGTTLQVTLASSVDFGTYSCKLAISQSTQPEVIHKIIQKISPAITSIHANNDKKVFDIGETLTLTCEATGYPKPKITWHKDNERLATDGENLTIENIKAKDSGAYRCLADNKVGKPDHRHIEIFVNHAPQVTIEKYTVNSDHRSDAELVCEVSAYPPPVVNWQRNGENISTKKPKIILEREKHNERNVLIIKDINENDFGEYTCVATNSLGKQVKNVTLVKTPVVRRFEKNHSNESIKDVILQWKVESKQPISMHELQYREKGETNWKTVNPEVTDGDNDVYMIKHTLKNLSPGVYEARARSKNNHGWSDYYDIIPFEGVLAKHGSHHQKSRQNKKEQKNNRTSQESPHDTPAQHRSEEIMPVGESTSGCMMVTSSILLTIIAILTIHIRP